MHFAFLQQFVTRQTATNSLLSNWFQFLSQNLDKNMSVQILAESVISLERTLVYQTVFENFVVLIQQKRQGDVWQNYQHCLIPKLFINVVGVTDTPKICNAPKKRLPENTLMDLFD